MNSETAIRKDFALIGLVAGLTAGVLSAAVLMLVIFPLIAHELFGTYLHYGQTTLEYVVGYVAIFGLVGVPAALLTAHRLIRKPDESLALSALHREPSLLSGDGQE